MSTILHHSTLPKANAPREKLAVRQANKPSFHPAQSAKKDRSLRAKAAALTLAISALSCSEPARQAPTPASPTSNAAAAPKSDNSAHAAFNSDSSASPGANTPPSDPTPVNAPAAYNAPSEAPAASNANSNSNGSPNSNAAASNGSPNSNAAASNAAGTRIWGRSRFTWIHPSPWVSTSWTGYIGLGGSVPLKGGSLETAKVASGMRCDAWYAVEPTGYVCAGETASVDPADPLTAALIRDGGKADSPWPFEYAESMGAPRYNSIPTLAEMRQTEWDLPVHMPKVVRAREAKTEDERVAIDKEFAGMDFTPAGTDDSKLVKVSVFVRVGQKYVAKGSTVAWVRAFDVKYPDSELGFKERTFLLTADHAIVPKDRVRPYPKSQVKGIKLGGDVTLPIAFFRKEPRAKYKKGADGTMVPTGETWPAKSWTMVTGEEVTVGKDHYVVTREEGIFAKAEDAHVVPLATPPSAKILEAKGRGTWLDISVLGGWLVAYEKTKPVLATLISPGRGGIPYPGIDPLKTASTPTGNFRVDGKFLWATMVSSSNSDIVHSEVQYVQNFHGPHAMHGAYWHDVFGEPKSGGCINLSPIDSKWMFEFTEPPLPDGWHGIRSTDQAGYATIVSVHR